jgi:hypothetical protein
MTTTFRTNIDCAKRFMNHISGLPGINPAVGDMVRVYGDTQCEIYMVVKERYWSFTNGASPVLTCYLSVPPPLETIAQFEKRLRGFGFLPDR